MRRRPAARKSTTTQSSVTSVTRPRPQLSRVTRSPTAKPALEAEGLATSLTVPGAWTLQQFDDVHGVADLPHYTNVQMPWPGRPPYAPTDRNPTGVHERDVEVPAAWAGRRIVLHVGAAE